MVSTNRDEILKRMNKSKNNHSQIETIFHYLSENIATASMVSEVTGIYQKNICRAKRDLEKAGLLWELKKDYCEHTGHKAWYLTTDPEKVEVTQLKLF